MRIKAKFVLSHVSAAMVPLLILVGLAAAYLLREEWSKVDGQLAATSAGAVTELEREFADTVNPLVALAGRLGAAKDANVVAAELRMISWRHPELAVLMLLDADGAVIMATRPGLNGSNMANHREVTEAQAGDISAGPVEFQPLIGRDGFAIALPVADPRNAAKAPATLFGLVDWRPFEAALSRVAGRNDGYHLILAQSDERRSVLFADPSLPFSDTAAEGLPAPGLGRGEVQLAESAFLITSARTGATAMAPDPGWTVYALIEKSLADSRLSESRRLAIELTVGALLLTLLFGYVLAARMVRPIEAITRAFHRASHNNLPAEIVAGDDEIGEMVSVLRTFHDNVVDMAKLSRALEQSPASVMIAASNGTIEYVNARFLASTGYSRAEVIGASTAALGALGGDAGAVETILQTVRQHGEWRGEIRCRRKDGSLFQESVRVSGVQDGGVLSHFVAVKEDLSLQREFEEELSHRANFDNLTDLPNRAMALDLLRNILDGARRANAFAGVLMIDIDGLRTLNDTMGHEAGDDLLRQAAARLSNCLREGDSVARMGGDEFMVMLSRVPNPAGADNAAVRVIEALSQPFLVGERDVVLGSNVGIAIYPNDGVDPHVLIRNADTALHLAKENGRNARRFFTEELHERATRRLAIETELRQALERGEFTIVYHPLVAGSTGHIVAAEALLRWNSRELGSVSPDLFVPVAEETGLIVPIGEWIIRTVCHDLRSWDAMGIAPIRVAVNVSSRQLDGWGMVKLVASSLEANGIDANRLEIEVTERLLLSRDAHTHAILSELKRMGVRLSIDDFGTGYSAMSYLTAFPFDVLKIDRSFVSAVDSSKQDAALAQAIIAMAHSLDLEVVAEGVEQERQVEFMCRNGAEFLQGFYFSQPLTTDQFALLTTGWIGKVWTNGREPARHPWLRVVDEDMPKFA